MPRLRTPSLLLLLVSSAAAQASDLGSDGRLHFAANAILTVDFEDPTVVAGQLQLVVYSSSANAFQLQPLTAGQIAPSLVSSNDALEGRTVLHWTGADGIGLELVDATTFASVASERVVVSFWGRASGMEPFLAVTYGNQVDIATNKEWAWARIPAIRTGRETSDGWVEYSTGPIDGTVLDRPIHDLILSARVPTAGDTGLRLASPALYPTDAIDIDAVELAPAPADAGTPQTGSCTMEDFNTSCGPAGECAYGRCVDAAVVWHPVPPLPMQEEIVGRVVNWATTFLGDRSAILRADAAWVSATLALASTTATPKTFWGALSHQIVLLRDTHTHFGAPYAGITTPFSVRPDASTGGLNLCFGPTLNDFAGSALAYVVWEVGPAAAPAFQVGDVVTQIDGLDPMTWAESVYPLYVGSMPVAPQADWAPIGRTLSQLIAKHAQTLTLTRCTSGGSCTVQPPIDIPTLSLAAISNGVYPTPALTCGPRFTNTVSGSRTDSSGGELLLSAELAGVSVDGGTTDAGTMAMEFDGFQPTSATAWKQSVDSAFALPHDRVIVDAREGFGGENALGDYLMQELRSTEAPAVLVLAARANIDDPNAASLFSFDWSSCATTASLVCDSDDIYIYQPSKAAPPGLSSRVAWLNTDDFSNNDMVPRVLQGRANLEIFAPFSTYGALGSDVEIPPLMPNWHAGSIAASDGKYGETIADAEDAGTFQSGTGVSPDVVVTQTLSDVLAGQDTIVNTAQLWLAQ